MGTIISGLLLISAASISGPLALNAFPTVDPTVLLGVACIVIIGVLLMFIAVVKERSQKKAKQNFQQPPKMPPTQRASRPPAQPRISTWEQQHAPTVREYAAKPEPQPYTAARAQPRFSSSGRLLSGVQLQHRYRVERAIAAGGMGAVYRAYDLNLQHVCAVKEMLERFHTEEERQQGLAWFRREARMLLNLHHPAIPRIFDSFAEEGRHYLVMDFIEGRTLGDVLEQEGQPRGLPERRVYAWAIQLCQVLAYLHRQQPPIIFRDLKPANIMVTCQDEIRLIDFGIARIFQEGTGTLVMTPGYAPLEQMGGNPEPRSDLYALGATLYQLLTLKNPRDNKPTIFDFMPIRQLRPDISPGFASIIFRAVQRDPADRWTSAAEMEQTLRGLAGG